MSPPSYRARLRGPVGDTERSYLLADGVVLLGSAPRTGNADDGADDEAAAIVLDARGVSRRHARLVVGPDGVTVEDLGSKNGTRVNGVRLERSRLETGDELGLGVVRLRLEALEPGETELALDLAGEAPGTQPPRRRGASVPAPPSPRTEPLGGDGAAALGALAAVEALVALGPDPERPGAALDLLLDPLGATTVWLLEWAGGETGPRVLAVRGLPAPPPGLPPESTPEDGGGPETMARHRGHHETSAGTVVYAARGARRLVAAGVAADDPRLEADTAERLLTIALDLLTPPASRDHSPPQTAPGPPRPRFPDGTLPGPSPAMGRLWRRVAAVAAADLPVLVLGESGVGKEHVARVLHASSPRRRGPFVALNCAALPAELLEAEVFGVRRGAASGVEARPGAMARADGGTLLLDEIGDMEPRLQAKLLRALEEGVVRPVGGEPVAVDVRLVAATNADLAERIAAGAFRADLYWRLAGAELTVPPLRQRPDDVPVLLEAFLRRGRRETGKDVRGVTAAALEQLLAHSWPGNVRELEHEVRRLVLECPPGQPVTAELLSERIGGLRGAGDRPHPDDQTLADTTLADQVEALERRLVRRALEETETRTAAAERLGIARNTLAAKIDKYGLG